MRKLTADYILLPSGKLATDHTLVVDGDGYVLEVLKERSHDAEMFSGILCPGFINAHCHLELSHMQGAISRHRSLDGFIEELIGVRKSAGAEPQAISAAAAATAAAAFEAGIQAIGDICNTSDTFELKSHSPIRYHNFIELFNMVPSLAEFTFETGKKLYEHSVRSGFSTSLVPHAPYSVPEELHRLIKAFSEQHESLWCIHSQETESENHMFESLTGRLTGFFQKHGFLSHWHRAYGKTSLEFIAPFFPSGCRLLLVHNTFTAETDISMLKSLAVFERTWFCLCPKANLYIENRLPDVMMLWKSGCRLTVGTDSLASNDTISVLEELKTIHRHAPEIPVADLLTWATANGAEYFSWSDLGKFEKGTKPGVVVISEAGREGFREYAAVERLM